MQALSNSSAEKKDYVELYFSLLLPSSIYFGNFTVSARFKIGKTHRFDIGKTMSSSLSHIISFMIASVPFTIYPSKSILRRHITRAPMHIGNCSNILAHSFSSSEGFKSILHSFLLACTGLKNNDRAMPTF
ncbi:unnamed protein product [Rotaria sp. Silwood1]|nr:unnamed protein product [Rotaria sp. Silwood1]